MRMTSPVDSAAPRPHRPARVLANALYVEHSDCDPDSCCQRNSGPDEVEANRLIGALWQAGYELHPSCSDVRPEATNDV